MINITKTIQKILEKHYYLHLYAITQLVRNEWVLDADVKNAEDMINWLILEDIKTNWINSTFIKVGLEQYALRKESELENLFSYIKCRLSNFIFWEINHHDIKYSNELFWKDIFSEIWKLHVMLDKLKSNWKIASYTPISNKQVIVWF